MKALPANNPEQAERTRLIVELRLGKLSWYQIGERVGLSHERCRQIFNEAMKEHVRPAIEQAREEAAQTYERLMSEQRALLQRESEKMEPDINTMRQITDSMGKLQTRLDKLFGTEAPVQVQQELKATVDYTIHGVDTEAL